MELGAEKINQIWRDAKLRAVGMKRATTLCETAKRSIGLKKGSSAARYEMKLLLEDYEYKKAQLDAVMEEIEKLCRKIQMCIRDRYWAKYDTASYLCLLRAAEETSFMYSGDKYPRDLVEELIRNNKMSSDY